MSDKRKISALLTDVDGTLVTKEKVLTERAREAVRRLKDAGIRLAVTSGRPPRGMAMLIEPLALDTPIAGFNGGVYARSDLSIVRERVLPRDVAARAIDIILTHGLDAWLYVGNDWFVRDPEAPHVARESRTVRFPPTVLRDLGEKLDRVAKIVGVSDDYDRVQRCEADAQKALGSSASALRSQPYYLDVTHPDANKGTVLDDLASALGVPPAEIATIGDMSNDVLMFRKSGLSIAMGNASPEVKKQASFVTDSNEEDGFAKAVERYILGDAAPS